MAAAPPPPADANILSKIPLYYFRDFKINNVDNSKKINDIYDITNLQKIDLKQSIKTSNNYKFKFFSMEINNEYVENDNCNTSDLDIDIDIFEAGNMGPPPNSAKNNEDKLQNKIYEDYIYGGFNTICNRNLNFDVTTLDNTIANPPGANKQVQKTINIKSFTDNLSELLEDIHTTYDIINFQDINPDNIKVLNSELEGKDTNNFKSIFLKVNHKGKEKHLTTIYNKNKFELVSYNIINNHTLILCLKMKNDIRILYLKNSITDYKDIDKDKKFNLTGINSEYLESYHNIEINSIPDDQKYNYSIPSIYKTYTITCCNIKNSNTAVLQHIKHPKFNINNDNQHYFSRNNNTIIFSNNLKMDEETAGPPKIFKNIFYDKYENLITSYDIENYIINDIGIVKQNVIDTIKNTFMYLGHSTSLGMGAEFNLGVDDFEYT
jgi:hypothetical protein